MPQINKQTIDKPSSTAYFSARLPALLLITLLLILPTLIYFPGINGPFLLDDFHNFVQNENLHISDLSASSLQEAANSISSGILGRPVAAISFAFNYYLAGGIEEAFSYKLFNIIIHTINGLLIFWFARLVFLRLQVHPARPLGKFSSQRTTLLLAGLAALLWVSHPIQLTSVLYVVQRMTSLAALFMLLAMIGYLKARISQQAPGKWIWLATVPLWGLLAVYSKETGFLLPLYILVLELVLFPDHAPWKHWPTLKQHSRRLILIGIGLLVALLITAAIRYSLPAYGARDFTLMERLLTESRALIFYIGQILIPRLSTFGLYHDDFLVSSSFLQPWTTPLAVFSVSALLLLALLMLRRQPLLSLGLLWFFISHALESTVYPFELIFEHRNYLASLGVMFIILHGLLWLYSQYHDRRIWLIAPVIVFIFSTSTAIRSYQWQDMPSMLFSHVENHPESPRAWADLSSLQLANNNYQEAISSLRRAILLDPREPGYLIKMYMYMDLINMPQPSFLLEKIHQVIKHNPNSILLGSLFHKMNECIDSNCTKIQGMMEEWNRTILEVANTGRYRYYLGSNLAVQGRFDEALQQLDTSIELSANQPSPYVTKIEIYLAQGKIEEAKKTYIKLKEISKKLYGTLTDKVLITGEKVSEFEPK